MSASRCGGGNPSNYQHASGYSHTKSSKSPAHWLRAIVLPAFVGIGVASAIALTAQPPAAPAVPAPAKAVDPATPPTTPAKPDAPKTAAPMKGVIRHGRPDPIPRPAGAIRIATYNSENFFDKDLPAGESGSSTPAKPIEHRKALAAAIHKINADVLALEEVESKETITKFRDDYLADMGYQYIASIDAGDPRGIEQSILSRFPLKDEKNWPGIPLTGNHADKLGNKPNPEAGKPMMLKRSPMRATVVVPAGPDGKPTEITLFAVHHKSGTYYSYLRQAEGVKVLELEQAYEKEHPGAAVLILGDFNARTTEKSYQVYTTGGMIDAMTGVPGGFESKEFISHSSGRTIDHILLNPAAAAMLDLDTRFVLGTLQRPEGVDWRTTQPPEGYASDHYPMVIDLLPVDPHDSTVKRGLTIPKAAPAPTPATDGK